MRARDVGTIAGISIGVPVAIMTTLAWMALPVAVVYYLFTH